MKIIVVDDEMSALHVFLYEIMYEKDVEYKFFRDDEKAIIDYVSTYGADAAFLDVRMPNVNGIDLARTLITLLPRIKIVFITGLTINFSDLPEDVRANTIGFIYKPYDKAELINCLNAVAEEIPRLTVKMFGVFECYLNGRRVEFSSQKEKELFALLLYYNGKTLTMNEAIACIWGDHDVEKAKKLYRDAVWRLRKSLQRINFNCAEFGRAEISLDRRNIDCDYWNWLDGKSAECGELLVNYDWTEVCLPGNKRN
ncbi:MAG: response regulator transcription factor [Candidatus Coproplasma sp.]